jgi:steroid delta-isomerase-like uncharacterized protein
MSEENKAITRHCWEGVSEGNLDIVEEVYAADCVLHQPNEDIRGVEAIKQFISIFLDAFPDLSITVEDEVSEGDKVVTRWTGRGTHQGELMSIPPTGRRVEVMAIVISYIRDGRIVEEWEILDNLGMLQQLGAIPRPGPAGG